MKKYLLRLNLLPATLFPLCSGLAQSTADVSPYNIEFATGYVTETDVLFSGQMVELSKGHPCGWADNKGFIVFDASTIPAGAAIQTAVLELNALGACNVGANVFATATGIPANPISGIKVTQKNIADGPIYADKLDWGASFVNPVIKSPLTADGISALQKKIGTAFCIGINPPTNSGTSRYIEGYDSGTAALRPILRVTYTAGNPSKPNADFHVSIRDTFTSSEIKFYDNSGNYPTAWLWEFGDDSVSTLQNPTHSYADTGYYTVKLTAKNAQGEDVMTKEKFIHISPIPPPPIAEFAVDLRNIAENETATFTDLSIGYITNWEWRFGDNEQASQQNPAHAYADKGVYDVKLIVSNPFGGDTLLKKEFMNVGGEVIEPIADFSADNTKGLAVSFYDLCKNFPDEWAWNFGDSSDATTQNPVHTYASEGKFNVCLEATNSAGTAKTCKEINTIKTGVSNNDVAEGGIILYPNPFTNKLFIQLNRQVNRETFLNIYGPTGRKIVSMKLNNEYEEVNMDSLPNGLYLARITNASSVLLTKKLLK